MAQQIKTERRNYYAEMFPDGKPALAEIMQAIDLKILPTDEAWTMATGEVDRKGYPIGDESPWTCIETVNSNNILVSSVYDKRRLPTVTADWPNNWRITHTRRIVNMIDNFLNTLNIHEPLTSEYIYHD